MSMRIADGKSHVSSFVLSVTDPFICQITALVYKLSRHGYPDVVVHLDYLINKVVRAKLMRHLDNSTYDKEKCCL